MTWKRRARIWLRRRRLWLWKRLGPTGPLALFGCRLTFYRWGWDAWAGPLGWLVVNRRWGWAYVSPDATPAHARAVWLWPWWKVRRQWRRRR